MHIERLERCIARATANMRKKAEQSYDLSIPKVYTKHADTVMWVANNIVLKHQRRSFIVDEHNRDVLRFLLYYFNDCPLAEDVFPGRGYKLHKHILLQGSVGTG